MPLEVVVVSPEVGVRVVVSNLKTSAVLAAKLEPETVTDVPAGPDEGFSGLSTGVTVVVTVKAAFAAIFDSPDGPIIVT